MGDTLLVFCGTDHDRDVVRAVASEHIQLQFCPSAANLARHPLLTEGKAGRIRAVVLDLDTPASLAVLPTLVAQLEGTSVPLLLRLSVVRAAIREIVAHAETLTDIRLSLQPCDSFGADVLRLLSFKPEPGVSMQARFAIIARSAPILTGTALPIVATAAAIGARTASVNMLASACRLRPRTLESRLAMEGVMAPKQLLQWVLSLHAAWSVCIAGDRLPDIAAAMGLSSAEALSSRVERVTGLRLRTICVGQGFDGLLEQFAMLLAGDSRGHKVRRTAS